MNKLRFTLILCLSLITFSCYCEDDSDQTLRVMTFNIRLNIPSDGLNAWPHRKDKAASMIQFHHADIVGLQEALPEQVKDFEERLPDYDWFGVGRDDGKNQGEYAAIFYKKERLKLLQHSTFWLSENPEIPGKGWDAACIRVVTWGQFRDRKTRKTFFLFNTHFDHKGKIARKESAQLLLKKIKEIAGNSNVIVTGDFNTTPGSIPYKILTESSDSEIKLVDTITVSQHPHHGPNRTFTGFKLSNLEKQGSRLISYFLQKESKSSTMELYQIHSMDSSPLIIFGFGRSGSGMREKCKPRKNTGNA